MERQKPGNLVGLGPAVIERQRVAQERATQRIRSWTGENEMRDYLGQVSAGAV